MRVSVAFTPSEAAAAEVAVAVDVLRATSTICAALAAGFATVACTAEVDAARARGAAGAQLAGERGCVRIDGFDFGNSPAELEAVAGAGELALTTTNGTRLLVAAAERCERVYVGALVNLDALVGAVAAREPDEVAVLCAGVEGSFALDDAYCAGRIVQALGGRRADSALAAVALAAGFPSARAALERSASAANLRRVGLGADLDWCARESSVDVVPLVLAREAGVVLVGREPATDL